MAKELEALIRELEQDALRMDAAIREALDEQDWLKAVNITALQANVLSAVRNYRMETLNLRKDGEAANSEKAM